MKKILIFAALVAAVVALSLTYGEKGTTFVMLLLVGVLYIFAEMNSADPSAVSNSRKLVSNGKKKVIELHKFQPPAACL